MDFVVAFWIILFSSHAINAREVRDPFEKTSKIKIHPISDCMHVTSEEGLYSFRKSEAHPTPTVCGLYVVADPNQIIEMTVKYLNVDCAEGGIMSFVDGWELNGQYFPSIHDHALPMEKRFTEFCSDGSSLSLNNQQLFRKHFQSSQNAALMQYFIPARGSFVISVRFVENKHPCHVMVEGVSSTYVLRNFGNRSNCTLTALFPAVVTIHELTLGPIAQEFSFNCADSSNLDHLDIGGSPGLNSDNMQVASSACGVRSGNDVSPLVDQAIFCGVTTVRLRSSGLFDNTAKIAIRPADGEDWQLVTAVCDA